MASHLTQEQIDTQSSIANFLNDSERGRAQRNLEESGSIARTVGNLSNRLAKVQDEIQDEKNPDRRQELEEERDDIYEALKTVDKELKKLTDQEATELLTQPSVALFQGKPISSSPPSAADAQRASNIRDRVRRQAEADSSEAAAVLGAAEFEALEDPGELDVEVIRSAYQSYLLYNCEFFAHYHNTLLNTGLSNSGYVQPAPTTTGGGTKTILETIGYRKKKETQPRIFLLSNDTDSSIVNNKLSLCPANEEFVKITTHEYASLMPLLRIFKIYRNGTSRRKVEFKFRPKTGVEGIEDVVSIPKPVGTKYSVFAKGVECGVKSFNWTFLGSDPYTATRDVQATLVLHAQHFSALAQTRGAAPDTYKYLDLIIQPDCNQSVSTGTTGTYSNYYDPGCYEVQIDVGYADQDGPLKDAICCQRDSLFLVHVDHKIDFKDDGTLDLTINYRGRLEARMNDKKFNVLLPGGGFSDAQGNKNSILHKYNMIEANLITAKSPTNGKPNKATIKKLERAREAAVSILRQYTYALILETMEGKNMIHSYPITNDEFLRFARWKEPRYVGALPDRLTVGSSKNPTTGADNSVPVQLRAAKKEEVKDDKKNAVQETMQKVADAAEAESQRRLQEAAEKQIINIDYVYLGDLLSIVLANTLGELPMSNIQTKTGNTRFEAAVGKFLFDDPSMSFLFNAQVTQDVVTTGTTTPEPVQNALQDVDNFHLVLGNIEITDANGKPKQINLAHIPISLEVFQDFMLKNVISQNIDYYSLLDFFDDLIGDVVTDTFSDQHIAGLVEADSRLSSTIFTSQTRLENSSVFGMANNGNNYSELKASKITPTNLPFGKNSRCADKSGEPFQYLVLNTMNSFPRNLAGTLVPGVRGDNIGDSNRGILHFVYGENKGLLKSVKFAKTDQEYLPESRFASSDGSLLNQLSSVYDATFNMVGNNIFKPGMLLYFNAESMGVGAPWQLRVQNGVVVDRSWSNIMGIGGYYLITEVSHNIAPGVFDTTLKTRWVTSGEDGSP